jgi:hypothetical protein
VRSALCAWRRGLQVSWLSLKTEVDGLSVVWSQNHWDNFLWIGYKTGGDSFLWFDFKINGDGFSRFGLKTSGLKTVHLVQRTGDGCTCWVLGGRTIGTLGDAMCGLHRARGDEDCEFLG